MGRHRRHQRSSADGRAFGALLQRNSGRVVSRTSSSWETRFVYIWRFKNCSAVGAAAAAEAAAAAAVAVLESSSPVRQLSNFMVISAIFSPVLIYSSPLFHRFVPPFALLVSFTFCLFPPCLIISVFFLFLFFFSSSSFFFIFFFFFFFIFFFFFSSFSSYLIFLFVLVFVFYCLLATTSYISSCLICLFLLFSFLFFIMLFSSSYWHISFEWSIRTLPSRGRVNHHPVLGATLMALHFKNDTSCVQMFL